MKQSGDILAMDDHFSAACLDHMRAGAGAELAHAVRVGDCFAMFHPGAAAEGIVILPPFGHEALSSAKTLRLLAQTLAGMGYPVLRIDFPGAGDSFGEEDRVGLIASRIGAAIDAVAWMSRVAGVAGVSLIGVRLGAAIALGASERVSLSRLMLIAPALSGRSYLRELEHLRAHYAVDAGAAPPAADEYNGFALSKVSRRQLEALDLRAGRPGRWASAAVMAPDGPGGASRLVANWRKAGATAEIVPYCPLAELLADPAHAGEGDCGAKGELIARASLWFGTPHRRGRHVFLPTAEPFIGADYAESACRFGADGTIFGVLCRPAGEQAPGPALIIANTGANPRSGWGRQTTLLARALAAEGFTTLRMDLAGVGETPDAPGRPARPVYVAQQGRDLIAAVDYLKSCGYDRPAIAGVCSGAFAAFHAARLGADIRALLMVNLQKFYWREGDQLVLYNSIGAYLRKFLRPHAWLKLAKGDADIAGVARMALGRISALLRARLGQLSAVPRAAGPGHRPEAGESPRADIENILKRKIAVSMIYTKDDGGMDEMRCHLGAGGAFVRAHGRFHFAVIEGADHNFSTAAARARLLPVLRDFLVRAGAENGRRSFGPNDS